MWQAGLGGCRRSKFSGIALMRRSLCKGSAGLCSCLRLLVWSGTEAVLDDLCLVAFPFTSAEGCRQCFEQLGKAGVKLVEFHTRAQMRITCAIRKDCSDTKPDATVRLA